MFPQKIWGGSDIDFTKIPDVTDAGYLNTNSSVNIATTKKAKYVILMYSIKMSSDNGTRRLVVYETDKGGVYTYVGNNGNITQDVITTSSTTMVVVTDNQVTITNNSASAQYYYTATIYY